MTFPPSSLLADASPQSGVFDNPLGGCPSTYALPGFSPGELFDGPWESSFGQGLFYTILKTSL